MGVTCPATTPPALNTRPNAAPAPNCSAQSFQMLDKSQQMVRSISIGAPGVGASKFVRESGNSFLPGSSVEFTIIQWTLSDRAITNAKKLINLWNSIFAKRG